MGEEQNATWYDALFRSKGKFRNHFSENSCFKCGLWPEAIKHITKKDRILELGCGSGQFAELLREQAIPEFYIGVDFSKIAIQLAFHRDLSTGSPTDFFFAIRDIIPGTHDTIYDMNYNTVVALEVLEHVEKDLEILDRIEQVTIEGVKSMYPQAEYKRTTKIIASVPDFNSESHVRHFKRKKDIHTRYGSIIKNLTVSYHAGRWLMIGVINP